MAGSSLKERKHNKGKWAKFGQGVNSDNQNRAPGGAKPKTSHPLVPLGRKVVAPNHPLSASQNQEWAPGGAKTKTVGPLGRKVVTPNLPLSASHGAQREVRGHNFSTQWSP